MVKYTIKRLLQTLIVLLGVSLVTFVMLNIVPGDPVAVMMQKRADQATIDRIRHEMGLDRPKTVQFLDFIKGAAVGDFGNSYFQKKPVNEILATGFKITATLGMWVILFACGLGMIFGISAAVLRGKFGDKLIIFISTLGMVMPSFWIAIVLQIIFGVKLKLLPISGLRSAAAYILPTFALGINYAASIARLCRTNMLDALNQDYVRTARAKGVSEFKIVMSHGLKNAAIPIITYIGILIKSILGGSVLVETVFSIPGLGKTMVDAITQRDIPLIQGCTIYIAVVFVLANLIIDLVYGLLDPRIRVAQEA
ncbi:MAG: ABC transporter permease [Clostridia bacterium]|nr:ABC transporter permease [Clostridia bacterium]